MTALRDVQAAFLGAMLEGEHDQDHAVPGVLDDGLTAAARLRIYRHHVFTSLTAALAATFPVVRHLVGEGFFAYAADACIRRHPPAGPCLSEYGASFADFLAGFPPCGDHAYLPDVARLEWAMNEAFHADEAPPLEPAALAMPADALGGIRLRLHPSVHLLESAWPVDTIWKANQADADPDATVDLDMGGVRLAIRRLDDDAVFHPLDPGRFAFWQALGAGRTLGQAADAGLTADPGLDLAAALRELLAGGLVVDLDITSGPGRSRNGTGPDHGTR
jgi:hypothetical protein